MDTDKIRVTAKTVADALTEASIQLGTSSDNIEYTVIEKGTSGFFGIGGKKAVIEARKKFTDEDLMKEVFGDKDSSKKEAKKEFKKDFKREKKEEKREHKEFKKEEKDSVKEEKEFKREPKKEHKEVRKEEGRREDSRRESRPERRNERRPERRNEPRFEQKPEVKPEPKSEPKAETKSEAKETKQETKTLAPASEKIAGEAAPKTPKVPADPEEAKRRAEVFLKDVFRTMEMEVQVNCTFEEDTLCIDLIGDDMGILIGKRGQTLDSLQYLTSLVVNKGKASYVRVKLDTEDYRNRRKATLENLARNIAFKVKKTRRPVFLEPMNPYERRIIHSALQNDPYVTTHSEGDEPCRKVVVTLKKREREK